MPILKSVRNLIRVLAKFNAFTISRKQHRSFSRPLPPLRCVAKSTKWEMTSPFRNGSHLPTTQCACANFAKWFSFTNHPMRMCEFRGLILLRNAMAAAAVKNIYTVNRTSPKSSYHFVYSHCHRLKQTWQRHQRQKWVNPKTKLHLGLEIMK
jgi:hypothetical protein